MGEIVRGDITAPNKDYVFNFLTKKQLTPVNIKEAKADEEQKKLKLPARGKISSLDRIILVKRLAAILKAGVPVVEGFDILIKDSEKPYLKKVLIEIKEIMERGEPLAAGFAAFPKDFSPVFIGLVQAGENTGNLDETLQEIVVQQQREYKLKSKVRSAMIYPAILLLTSIFIIIILVTFILPRITVAFAQSNVELPFITRIVIGVSSVFSQSPLLTILGFFVFMGLGAFLTIWSPASVKTVMEKILMRIPLISKMMRQLALARFAGILSGLLGAGLPATEALKITGASIGNETYRKKLAESLEAIKRGTSIADSLREDTRLFPHILISMVAVGEKSGTLDETLGSLGEFYEEEVDRLVENLLSLLEPLLLLVMGLIVGVIAMSILLPIYKMVSGIQ